MARLPSLLKLRDALYSAAFREYLSTITGAGDLSGKKTDMAINVYTGGCHLLCHDDVIGSRRLSYILYLTNPDVPWEEEWGGALRLYPTETVRLEEGKEMKTPSSDFSVAIPPAFNQLSYFAVQPGRSFHDVEEVYHSPKEEEKTEHRRTRMAISGWYHIPQEGEEGYEEGLDEKLAEKSSLAQLQGKSDALDLPQPHKISYGETEREAARKVNKSKKEVIDDGEDLELTETDLDFLLKFITPSYLTPDIMEELSENFSDESSLRLETFLCDKFANRIQQYIESREKESLPESSVEIEKKTPWKVARPPHKHRFLYRHYTQGPQPDNEIDERDPIQELLRDLLPSKAFKKWLNLATGLLDLLNYDILARRFRKGKDYTLASSYDGDAPSLEYTIGLTPSAGWEEDEEDEDDQDDGNDGAPEHEKSQINFGEQKDPHLDVGGYEVYMAGDGEDEEENGAEDGVEVLQNGASEKTKRIKADPAVYKASGEEDDGILFTMPAGWNRMSLVLRDKGTLKFVKYISRSAKGDRWDVTGAIDVGELQLEMWASNRPI